MEIIKIFTPPAYHVYNGKNKKNGLQVSKCSRPDLLS